jgi:hypothetical protein
MMITLYAGNDDYTVFESLTTFGCIIATDSSNDLAVLNARLTPSAVPAFNSRVRVGQLSPKVGDGQGPSSS